MKKIKVTFLNKLSIIVCFLLLVVNNLNAADTRNTIAAGNWSSVSTWNGTASVPGNDDNVTINHTVNLDANWGPQNSGSIVINSASSGSGTLNMSGGTLLINANVTLTGTGINLTGGTITVKSGYTLTMPGFNEANTHFIVESGATLVVNGNLLNNHGNIAVEGLITINGNYDGQASNATVTGNGNITSTGYMQGINQSSIFGTQNFYCPSNCDGRNLFGGATNCSGTAAATPSTTSICLGASVSFTSTLTGGYTNNQPLVYQWQIKNNSNVFVNISGATTSTYSASPSVSSIYRVLIGDKQNPSEAYCYKTSPAVTITVAACVKSWVGGTNGNLNNWHTSSNWSPSGVPASTDNIVIPSSTYYPVISSGNSANVKNITIQSGSSLTVNQNNTLNVYGNFVNSGAVNTDAGSTITMHGNTLQTISGVSSVHNLIINNINGYGVSLLSPISVNGSLSLVSGVLTTNNYLTINFDAGGNISYNTSDAGSINGNVTGTRNLVAKTHYIATPFTGVTTSQINATTPVYRKGVWLLTTKNYGAQSWNYVKDSTTASIAQGAGYALAMFNAAPLTFTGTYSHNASYNSGNYVNKPAPPSSSSPNMYFMMGNPYPSTIDWDNPTGWVKSNVNDAIYFWNPATSSVSSYVNGVGTNGATQFIPAMQSFLVTTTGTGGMSSLMVNNNARVLTNTSYFRSSSPDLVRLVVRNEAGSSADETVVRMDDLATADYDSDADAFKVSGLLSLYTKNSLAGPDYSINTLPISGASMVVPLNLRVAVNGLYTIECKEYSIPGYSMILEDKLTQSYTIMDNSTIYTLNASAKDSVNRFVLRFVAGLTTGTTSATGVSLQISTYENQAMLNVSGIQSSNAIVNIYDASGLNVMRLDNQTITPGIQTVGLPGLPGGLYIVKIEIEGTTHMGKVVLK